jgi:hypothetical protein
MAPPQNCKMSTGGDACNTQQTVETQSAAVAARIKTSHHTTAQHIQQHRSK